MDHYVNAVVIDMYMKDQTSQFCNRFQDFQQFDLLFFFSSSPRAAKTWNYLNLNGSIWKTSRCCWSILKHLYCWHRNLLISENRWKRLKTSKQHFNSWESLPEKFSCLKKMAIALLWAFGSTCLREQIFSHMKFIFSPHRSQLTKDHTEAYVFNWKCPNLVPML